jgi:hypothetical protein
MPTPHSDCSCHSCRTVVLAALLVASPVCGLAAQARAATTPAGRCDRTAATSFSYGRTGGSIRPTATHVAAAGGAERDSGAALVVVSPAVLNGLARLARAGGFATLPAAPTRPTPNPDAARDFIELRSVCGAKHVEYAAGTGAPVFRELYALLTALGGASGAR